MTSLFPHPACAEDQQNAQAILYLHVMRASTMSFAFLSLFRIHIPLLRSMILGKPINMPVLISRTLQTSGRAAAMGGVVGAFLTRGHMTGRDEIEWQDRSWRILENEGEKKTDWVTLGGAGAGAALAALAARRGAIPTRIGPALVGGAAAGSSVGIPFMFTSFALGRKPA